MRLASSCTFTSRHSKPLVSVWAPCASRSSLGPPPCRPGSRPSPISVGRAGRYHNLRRAGTGCERPNLCQASLPRNVRLRNSEPPPMSPSPDSWEYPLRSRPRPAKAEFCPLTSTRPGARIVPGRDPSTPFPHAHNTHSEQAKGPQHSPLGLVVWTLLAPGAKERCRMSCQVEQEQARWKKVGCETPFVMLSRSPNFY
jgi:hypothetical protein